jgi:competence protein ComEC
LLYDGGTQDDLAMGPRNRILAYLAKVRPDLRAIDHVILSHPHKDHLELLPDVFDKYEVRNVWESGRVNPTGGYCKFLTKVVAEPGVRYHDAIASNAVRNVTFPADVCGGSTIRVIQSTQMPETPVRLGQGAQMRFLYRDARPYSDPNGNSVVVRVDLGNRRILLAGDAEGGDRTCLDTPRGCPATPPRPNSIEGQLLDRSRGDLRADVLIVGHHGSVTSSRIPFLDAVQATTFVISSGPHAYQQNVLPDPEVVTELRSRGRLFQTNEDDVACGSNPAKIGPDADNRPGGCKNVLIGIAPGGVINADYAELSD